MTNSEFNRPRPVSDPGSGYPPPLSPPLAPPAGPVGAGTGVPGGAAGAVPPAPAGPAGGGTTGSGSGSPTGQKARETAETAKDQAASVADSATAKAQHVAGTAKEQAQQVVQEGREQLRQLADQAGTELTDQARVQQERVASGLHSLADELRSMADGSEQQGVATDLAHQAAERAQQFADFLDNRDPGAVLSEVRAFARRRPGMFLLAAFGAGAVAGRLVRGLTADNGSTQGRSAVAGGYPATGSSPGPALNGPQVATAVTAGPAGIPPDGSGGPGGATSGPTTGFGAATPPTGGGARW